MNVYVHLIQMTLFRLTISISKFEREKTEEKNKPKNKNLLTRLIYGRMLWISVV